MRHTRLALGVALAACFLSLSSLATEWHVNQALGDDAAAASDASGQTAFRTIQAALDRCAPADTIWVDPGTYDSGARVAIKADGSEDVVSNRLWIAKKVNLFATGDRGNTLIVGRRDPNSANGLGPAAVRCIGFGVAAEGSVVRGFTLRSGATPQDKNLEALSRVGGAACGYKGNVHYWLEDCTLEDCQATQAGAAYNCSLARCIVRNCKVCSDGAWLTGAATRACNQFWCVFVGNSGAGVVSYPRNVINCTFCANGADAIHNTGENYTAYNCVFDSQVAYADKMSYRNCASTAVRLNANGGMVDVHDAKGALMVAPLLGDGRLVASTVAAGLADPSYVTKIPERCRLTDVEGNAVSNVSGKVHPGAYQRLVTPAGGLLEFRSTASALTGVDGRLVPASLTNYVWATAYPTQFLFKAVATDTANTEIRVVDNFFDGVQKYEVMPPIDTNNTCWISAPPAGHTNAYSGATSWKSYIDCNTTADSRDGTAAKPFRSFKEAIESKLNANYANRIFYVKPGVYTNDPMTSKSLAYKARLIMPDYTVARFIAVGGPARTFIVGAEDPATAGTADRGCGVNAVRIAGQENNGAVTILQGFTLTGGRAGIGAADAKAETANYGVICRATVGNFQYGRWLFTDCVISNNVSPLNLAVSGNYGRCLFADNEILPGTPAEIADDYRALARSARFYACVFTGNKVPASVTHNAILANCTLDAAACVPYRQGQLFGSVVSAGQAGAFSKCFGCVLDGCGTTGAGRVNADPEFADRANRDYRVFQTSPAVGLTAVPQADADKWSWHSYAYGDFLGNRLRYLPDGTIVAGARQDVVPAITVSATAGRGVDVLGRKVLDEQGRATVTATEADTRNLIGFAVDGVLQPSSGTSFTFVLLPAFGRAPVVEAVYSTNWYVNVTAADDAQSGADAEHPKRTLAAALRHAVRGDVVHVAPGDYGEGTALHPMAVVNVKADPTVTVRSRAVVPDGVTLESTDGRDVTFIRGQAATADGDDLGCGPDAVRCVYLGTNAVLRGFTLVDGHTGDQAASEDDRTGGGVITPHYRALIEDCTIRNCACVRTTCWSGTYRRCRIVDNRAPSFNPGLREAVVEGCLIDNNVGNNALFSARVVRNTTFGPGNRYPDGRLSVLVDGCTEADVVGCVFCHEMIFGNTRSNNFVRCVLPTGNNVNLSLASLAPDCILTEAANLALDGRGAPVIGVNPAVDAGSAADWASHPGGDLDACGGQRVYNGRIDIGAVEADWRPAYARLLSGSGRYEVVEADRSAVAKDNRVFLPSGKLVVRWRQKGGGDSTRYRLSFAVVGPGALQLSRNGEAPVTYSAGAHEVAFDTAQADNELSFDFVSDGGGDGGVYLNEIAKDSGLIMMVK